MEEEEIWRDIEGFDGMYQVSNLGRVKSLYRTTKEITEEGRILKASIGKRGYWYVALFKDGKNHTKTVHRLMANAFMPNPDNLPNINHISGIRSDNRLENFEWCTQKQNMHHAFRTGLVNNTGEMNGMSLLTEGDVVQIKHTLKNGYFNLQDIADEYNISLTAIYDIKAGRTWKHVVI